MPGSAAFVRPIIDMAEVEPGVYAPLQAASSAGEVATTTGAAATEAVATGTAVVEAGTVAETAVAGTELAVMAGEAGTALAAVEVGSGGLATPVVVIAAGALAVGAAVYWGYEHFFAPANQSAAPLAPIPVPQPLPVTAPQTLPTIHSAPPPPAPPVASGENAPKIVWPLGHDGKSNLQDIHFDFDRFNLSQHDLDLVRADAAIIKVALQANSKAKVVVDGHTDTMGTNPYNDVLSQKRAEAVKAELVKDGVDANAIEIKADGKGDLAVETGDQVKSAANRRATLRMEHVNQSGPDPDKSVETASNKPDAGPTDKPTPVALNETRPESPLKGIPQLHLR